MGAGGGRPGEKRRRGSPIREGKRAGSRQKFGVPAVWGLGCQVYAEERSRCRAATALRSPAAEPYHISPPRRPAAAASSGVSPPTQPTRPSVAVAGASSQSK